MPRTGSTCIALVVAATAATMAVAPAPAQPLSIAPAPKAERLLSGSIELLDGGYSILGKMSPRVAYAVGILAHSPGAGLREAEGPRPAVRIIVADSAQALTGAAGAAGVAAPPPEKWQEAYVLDAGATDSARVTLTGGPTGIIYGAYTIDQLVRRSPHASRLPRCAVSDWPTMLTRGYTGCVRDVSDASLERLDWISRWRLNAAYYEIYGDRGQDGAPPEVTDIHREYARRGIKLYGLISNWRTERLLKRELCASNPDDLARIRRYATELLDRGCDGLIFLFDDITRQAAEHTTTCELCKGRFAGLAQAQLELMRPMLEVARKRGVSDLIVCPTPYYDDWRTSRGMYGGKLDGEAYYAVWRDAQIMDGVQVFHCLLRGEKLAEVQQAGLRNYIYWYNDTRAYSSVSPGGKRVEGMWGGFTQLAFGWYCHRWDTARGPVPLDDTYDAFRRLPELTQHAWLCGGGDYPWAIWGCYCWDADRFAPDRAERSLVAALYGAQAEGHYQTWKRGVRQWLPMLLAPRAVTASPEREAVLARLQADEQSLSTAAGAFEQAVGQGMGVAPSRDRDQTASRMVATARAMAQTARSAALGKARVTVGPMTTAKLAEGVRRERRIELGDFWTRFILRHSQTEDPDGTLHRSQWHFGSGLGMLGPSYRNWYDAGFIDVLIDGKSLDSCTPTFEVASDERGDALLAIWQTDQGTVRLGFSPWEGGLRITGTVAAEGAPKLSVQLFAIPGAGWGDRADMDKYVVTASGQTAHSTPVALGEGGDWLFLADRTYDVPHGDAEGPCAVLFGDPLPAIRCDNGSYVVQIDADYPDATHTLDIVVWDLHGQKNAVALEQLQARLEYLRKALRAATDRD